MEKIVVITALPREKQIKTHPSSFPFSRDSFQGTAACRAFCVALKTFTSEWIQICFSNTYEMFNSAAVNHTSSMVNVY